MSTLWAKQLRMRFAEEGSGIKTDARSLPRALSCSLRADLRARPAMAKECEARARYRARAGYKPTVLVPEAAEPGAFAPLIQDVHSELYAMAGMDPFRRAKQAAKFNKQTETGIWLPS